VLAARIRKGGRIHGILLEGEATQWDTGAFTQLLDITALGIGNSASSLPINA